MSQNYLYPKDVNLDQPLDSNLIELWDEGFARLLSRRNRGFLWLIPSVILFLYAMFVVLARAGDYILLFLIASASLVGLVGKALVSSVEYWVSEDRRSAHFTLRHRFSFRSMLEDSLFYALNAMKEGFGGFLTGALMLLFLPAIVLGTGIWGVAAFFNKLFWLADFHNLDEEVKSLSEEEPEQHVKGTRILPPEQLSGKDPRPDSIEEEPNSSDEGLEVLDGKLTLYQDGGLAMMGGASFDVTSTFENLSMGDLVLTRKDAGLLRVHYEGEDHAFFYNGSEWSKVG